MPNVTTVTKSIAAETILWRSRIQAAGGGFEWNSVAIADRFIKTLKAAPYYNKIRYLLPMLGTGINAARVPLIDRLNVGAATNNNLVDADFSQSTGLTGNGSNKFLNTLIKASQIGTSSNGGLGYWATTIGTDWVIGSRDSGAGQLFAIALASDALMYWGDGTSSTNSGQVAINAHYYAQRSSASSRILYRNAIQVASTSTSPSVSGIGTSNIMVMGIDASFNTTGRCGVAYMTDGTMTSAEIVDFNSLLAACLMGPTGKPQS